MSVNESSPRRGVGALGSAARRALRDHGPIGLAAWVRDRVGMRWSEMRLGVDTRGAVDAADLGIADATGYVPVDPRCFARIMAALDLDATRDVFLDYGAGLGRPMLLAAQRPFRRVLGIEYDQTLFAAGTRNIESARRRLRCQDIELVHGDAVDYEVPPQTTVIFFFHPFGGATLERVVDRIEDSLQAHPRRMSIVHIHPRVEAEVFTTRQWVESRTQLPSDPYEDKNVVIYTTSGGAA